jgi:hypothetical protein
MWQPRMVVEVGRCCDPRAGCFLVAHVAEAIRCSSDAGYDASGSAHPKEVEGCDMPGHEDRRVSRLEAGLARSCHSLYRGTRVVAHVGRGDHVGSRRRPLE